MKTRIGQLALLSLLTLPACVRRPVATISAEPDNVVASRWNATLSTPTDMQGIIQAQGRSWITSVDGGRRTRVDVELSNMVSGGQHPWVLRAGQCRSGGPELARAEGSNALRIGGDGRARASTEFDRAFPTTGDYVVEVLASSQNANQVVACGNFAPPNLPAR